MKAIIGRRHPECMILTQLDAPNRTWTSTYLPIVRRTLRERITPSVVLAWLIVSAFLGYVGLQILDTAVRH